jgi:transcriptional accessory protein Tex/SPT6
MNQSILSYACIILPDFEKPLFRKEVQDVNSLKIGTVLTGKITNVTHFGAFVDIGVGQNGLIHTSKMKNSKVNLGDKFFKKCFVQ